MFDMLDSPETEGSPVGHNAAIKHYFPLSEGRPVDLFDSCESRRLVLFDLLATPWFVSASRLQRPGDGGLGRRINEPVAVSWDPSTLSPTTFRWRGQAYHIESIVQTWAIEHAWWDVSKQVSQRCWRVLVSDGGTYDLAFDRLARAWVLLGMQD
jgi:hypothetical protein